MFDIPTLVLCGLPIERARVFAEPLRAACERFDLVTPRRFAAFMGQIMVESADLSVLEERLSYSSPIRLAMVFPGYFKTPEDAVPYIRQPTMLANKVYANRSGNGSEASGDGWRYRGRGAIQLTFRGNYAAAEAAVGRPYVSQPDLVAQPADAVLSAAWFFASARCIEPADAGDIATITRRVNGPRMLELERRREVTNRVLNSLQQ